MLPALYIAHEINAERGTRYEGLAQLKPALKEPSWPRLIGQQAEAPSVTLEDLTMTKAERKKRAKATHNKQRAISNRVARLLSGQFVRTRKAKAA
jgi:hypothetical protein